MAKTTKDDDLRMPFLEHLTELRRRLLQSLAAVGVCFLVAYNFAEPIFRWLTRPFDKAYQEVFKKAPNLIYTGMAEPFLVYLKVGILAGCFLASPVVFYQIWRFIAPGL